MRFASMVEPFNDLGGVKAYEVPDLYIGDLSVSYQPPDVTGRAAQALGECLDIDQLR
jgi:hypothetical protein